MGGRKHRLSDDEISIRLDRCGIDEQQFELALAGRGKDGREVSKIPVKPIGYNLVFEGDQIVGSVFAEKGNISIAGLRWPSRYIYYDFAPDIEEDSHFATQVMIAAKEEFNARTNVVLRRLPKRFRDAEQPPDHIFFMTGSPKHAVIGHRPGMGPHPVVIPDPPYFHDILHETGHALGLWHEHTRCDRDEHIEVCWDNIRPDCLCVFKKWEEHSVPHGTYDYHSVMNYKSRGSHWALDPDKPIMRSRTGGEFPDFPPDLLSDGDIQAINAMYPLS